MFDAYLNSALKLLTSLPGILGVVALVICFAAATRSARVAVWLLAAPLFVSCFGRYRYITAEYVVPLNYFEHYSRLLFATMLLVMIVAFFSNPRFRTPFRRRSLPICFYLFQLYYAVLLIVYHEDMGWMALMVFTVSFFAVSKLQSNVSATRRYSHFVEAVVLAGVLFTLASCYQYVRAPSNSVWAGRFIGITNNSQLTAQFLSLFIIPTFYYLVNLPRGNRLKLGLGMLLLLQSALLLYTGSRTGMLMTMAGLLILMRRQSRNIVAACVVLGIVGFALASLLPETEYASQRILSLQDTRSGLFRVLWERFLEHPISGEMEITSWGSSRRAIIRENSYLMVASMMGSVGIIIFGVFFIQLMQKMVLLWNLPSRRSRPGLIDLILASLTSIFIGAFFEGFLFAIVGPCYLLIYAYTGFADEIAGRSSVRKPARMSITAARLQRN